jgi:hypothetical protein
VEVMGDGLGLDAWWDEPAYHAARGSFSTKGTFILRKLSEHDPAKLKDVLGDLYRDDLPDPADTTKFEWEVIRGFLGASPEEVKDVQLRMWAGVAVTLGIVLGERSIGTT